MSTIDVALRTQKIETVVAGKIAFSTEIVSNLNKIFISRYNFHELKNILIFY